MKVNYLLSYFFVIIFLNVNVSFANGTFNKKNIKNKPSLNISVLLPLTGPGASGAKFSKEGFLLAKKEIVSNGGDLKLSFEDTQTNPKKAVSIVHRLNNSPFPPNVLVPQLSSVMRAIEPMVSNEMLTVSTGVSIPNVTDSSKNRFRIFISSEGIGTTAANWVKKQKLKSPCVIYVNDEYGQSCLTSFIKNFDSSKNTISYEPFSIIEKDFRIQWKKIIMNKNDCVFIAGYGPGYLAVIKQMREQGYNGKVITDWSITSPDYMTATQKISNGFFVISVKVPNNFVSLYEDTYKRSASYINAGYSYDTLMCIWNSYINSDGSVKDMSNKIITFNSKEKYPGLMDSNGIQANGDLSVNYSIFKINNGNLIGTTK